VKLRKCKSPPELKEEDKEEKDEDEAEASKPREAKKVDSTQSANLQPDGTAPKSKKSSSDSY
jgi:hypothetical protein